MIEYNNYSKNNLSKLEEQEPIEKEMIFSTNAISHPRTMMIE